MSLIDLIAALFGRRRPAPPVVPPPQPPPPPVVLPDAPVVVPPGPSASDIPAQLLAAHNAERVRHGKAPLDAHPALDSSSAIWAAYIASTGRLDHYNPAGSTPWTRIRSAGFPYATPADASENIAWGQESAALATADWLADPPHRANVLGDWTHMGGAAARGRDGRLWWVCDYGRLS